MLQHVEITSNFQPMPKSRMQGAMITLLHAPSWGRNNRSYFTSRSFYLIFSVFSPFSCFFLYSYACIFIYIYLNFFTFVFVSAWYMQRHFIIYLLIYLCNDLFLYNTKMCLVFTPALYTWCTLYTLHLYLGSTETGTLEGHQSAAGLRGGFRFCRNV